MLAKSLTFEPLLRFDNDDFLIRAEVCRGLISANKSLPAKLFYDKQGSELFDVLCDQDEYYPTRTELSILESNANSICAEFSACDQIVEYGGCNARKARILFDTLQHLKTYIPIDISRDYLHASCAELEADYPHVDIMPIVADYLQVDTLPVPPPPEQRVMFFPGSTIGNLHRPEAVRLLRKMLNIAGQHGRLLIGVDLKKDAAILELAYNDAQGITAEFNKNILRRLNNELDMDFVLDDFDHHAFYNARKSRIEMHLVCRRDVRVSLSGMPIPIRAGETIHTESSYKYSVEEFQNLCTVAGLAHLKVWTDSENLFSMHLLGAPTH